MQNFSIYAFLGPPIHGKGKPMAHAVIVPYLGLPRQVLTQILADRQAKPSTLWLLSTIYKEYQKTISLKIRNVVSFKSLRSHTWHTKTEVSVDQIWSVNMTHSTQLIIIWTCIKHKSEKHLKNTRIPSKHIISEYESMRQHLPFVCSYQWLGPPPYHNFNKVGHSMNRRQRCSRDDKAQWRCCHSRTQPMSD